MVAPAADALCDYLVLLSMLTKHAMPLTSGRPHGQQHQVYSLDCRCFACLVVRNLLRLKQAVLQDGGSKFIALVAGMCRRAPAVPAVQ